MLIWYAYSKAGKLLSEQAEVGQAKVELVKTRVKLDLVRTSEGCPEQYTVYNKGRQCGYIRLRGGVLRAIYPNPRGVRVHEVKTLSDGYFMTEAERRMELYMACNALLLHEGVKTPDAELVLHTTPPAFHERFGS